MFCTRNPIFVDRRFNCPRKILKTVLESGKQKEKAILQFCSIFESRVKLFLSTIYDEVMDTTAIDDEVLDTTARPSCFMNPKASVILSAT